MLPPRYQVFLSATFDDLEKDRLKAILAVMRVRQFPVGMEVMTAGDDRGWRQIQKLIDNSDYYFVIVGGRYGSIDVATGISWTEREYNYAGEKGIKRMAFIRKDNAITVDKMDRDADAAKKQEMLARFKEMLRGAHKVEFWETAEELARKVQEGLTNQIDSDREDGELPSGWVRGGDSVANLTEFARLSEENRKLREELAAIKSAASVELVVREVHADGGKVVVHNPRLVLEEEEPAPPWGRIASLGPSREDMAAYLDRRSRAARVCLVIANTGTTPARDVEVRLKLSNVDDVPLDLQPPHRFAVGSMAAADVRRNGARNVVYESARLMLDDTAQIVQRVKLIPPGSDAELERFWAIAKGTGFETPFRLEITAIESGGHTATASVDYNVVSTGVVVVPEEKFREQ